MSLASIERAWTERPLDEAWWRRVVVVHAIATWFLVGMIWTIQVVHYPLFPEVGPSEYVDFQAAHVERIGPLLAVPWAVEGAATIALLVLARSHRELLTVVIAAAAGGAVLLISGFASAPAHSDLADGFDAAVHDRLMAWNLVRTVLWTVKGIAAALLLWWVVAARRVSGDESRSA